MINALLAVWIYSAALGAAPPSVSTTTYTVSTLYTGDQFRDPFVPRAARSRASARLENGASSNEPEDIDIHALRLNGILEDRRTDYAVFAAESGETLILRAGTLYDSHRHPVPGVKGRIDVRQRRVTLTDVDGDVQRYVLGESHEQP